MEDNKKESPKRLRRDETVERDKLFKESFADPKTKVTSKGEEIVQQEFNEKELEAKFKQNMEIIREKEEQIAKMTEELEKLAEEKAKWEEVCRRAELERELMEQETKYVSVKTVFNERPLLSNKLSSPTFENLENLENPKWESILPLKRMSTWTISPRMLIPAITWESADKLGNSCELPPDWREVEKNGKVVYVHAPTGLEHYLRPTGKGIPQLRYWEPVDFKNHLKQADDAQIEDVLIWPLVENCELNGRELKELRGNYRGVHFATRERNLFLLLARTVYETIASVLNEALKGITAQGPLQLDFDTCYDSQDQNNCPSYLWQKHQDRIFELCCKTDDDGDDDWHSIAYIYSQIEVDFELPCTKDQCSKIHSEDAETRSNLVKFYLETETGRSIAAEDNALIQIRTHLGMYHRRFGIITTFNTWTFVRLDEDGVLHVSPTFEADKQPGHDMDMSLIEILLRFIVAGIGKYKFGDRPNDLMEQRPEFVKQYLRQRPRMILDTKDWVGYSPNGQEIGPVCWADLEDARRNAPGIHLTWQESLSYLGALDGDAPSIEQAEDLVYRKKFGDFDLAIKTIPLDLQHDDDEGPVHELLDEFGDELKQESSNYQKMRELQGQYIPRFYGLRPLQGGICLITDYVGPSFDSLEKITKDQMKSALNALSVFHNRDMLHGNVELCNVVWNEALGKAFWINLTSCEQMYRGEDARKMEWGEVLIKEEYRKAENMLNRLVA